MHKFLALLSTALLVAPLLPEDAQARGGRVGGFGRGMGAGGMNRGYWGGLFGAGYPTNPTDLTDGASMPEEWKDPYPQYEKDNNGYWGGWGGIRGQHSWGTAGGWARPHHRFSKYGWGGWSTPYYGTGGGYRNKNFSEKTVDAAGNLYPPNSYTYVAPPISKETWTYSTVKAAELKSVESDIPKEKIDYKSKYRLGPDADIIKGGKIAFHLTDDAFLMISDSKLIVVDETTGYAGIVLYPDKALMWHLAQQVEQQTNGLKATVKQKGSLFSSPLIKASKEKTKALYMELDNINKTIGLLEAARTNIGQVGEKIPTPEKPAEPGAIEVFSSTWMSPDGQFVIARIEDGSYIYIDGKGVYTDNKKTPLKKAYPGIFEKIVSGYLKILINESNTASKNLRKDNKNTKWAISNFKSKLKSEVDSKSSKSKKNKSKNKSQSDSNSKFAKAESKRRIKQALLRSQHRAAAITNQMETMPKEVKIAKKLVKALNK